MARPRLTDRNPKLVDNVLALHRDGKGKKAIATLLYISPGTVLNILRAHGIDISGNGHKPKMLKDSTV